MSEAELQSAVIDLARVMGWRVAHFRAAQNARGQWSTAIAADGVGFPDLILVRPGECIVAELKSDKGTVGTNQRVWLDAFVFAGVRAFIWRPGDWKDGSILEVLQRVPVTTG